MLIQYEVELFFRYLVRSSCSPKTVRAVSQSHWSWWVEVEEWV